MDIRRSSLTGDRRRRLLTEESGLAPTRDDVSSGRSSSTTSTGKKKRPRKERYTPDASWEAQPRITDLIPRRKLTITAWFTLGVLCVAGLEWLYALMPSIAHQTSDGRIAAFDLDGEGSLAAYFSSMVLFFAACSAVLIYTLRRHRLDDYRARYRIWLWAAMAWLVMSIDESGSLHEGFKEFMAYSTGSRLYGDGSLWWVIAYGVTLGVIGLRLLWDMRTYRPSTTAISLSAVSFLVAVIVQLELLLAQRGAKAVMVEEGCEMAGALFLLLAMVLHARFIIFDIEGRHKKAKAGAVESKATENKTDDSSKEPDADAEQDEPRSSSRKGTGLLPWRLSRKKKSRAIDDPDEVNEKPAKSRSNKAEQKRKKKAIAEQSESDEPELTRRERKAIAKREKQEAAELRRMEKEEKRRLDKAEATKKPKRLGFLRRKPREEVAVAADEAPVKKQSAKQNNQSSRKQKQSKTSNDSDANAGGNKRQLTKAERKALRRERRRQERERNADDDE